MQIYVYLRKMTLFHVKISSKANKKYKYLLMKKCLLYYNYSSFSEPVSEPVQYPTLSVTFWESETVFMI